MLKIIRSKLALPLPCNNPEKNQLEAMSNTTQPGLDLSSPVTVLPLVAAIATVVFTFIGGCIVYHRRQRKRTQELVRQLRVTERRIDAIGMITAKKQQALASRKAEYSPPVAAPCSSASTLGITNVYTTQPPLEQEQLSRQSVPDSNTYEGGEKEVTVTLQVTENCTTTDGSDDTKLDAYDASYYCSTCKLEESVSESVLTQYRSDIVNSSMAVECATIPAVSSLSTVCSTNRNMRRAYKVHNKMTRSKSELHRTTLKDQLSKKSQRIMRGLGLASAHSTEPPEDKLSATAKPDILARQTLVESKEEAGSPKRVTLEQSESEGSTMAGQSTAPEPSRQLHSTAAPSQTGSCTTDTEGGKEKWV